MISSFALYTYESSGPSSRGYTDFQIGRIRLARHLTIRSKISGISVSPRFAKQLLLQEASDFASGRVPVYVCGCCADLGCGAVTVSIERNEDLVVWLDFGWEGLDSTNFSQSEYMQRTGPFFFSFAQYFNVLKPYTAKR